MLLKPLKTTCYDFDKYYFVKNPFIVSSLFKETATNDHIVVLFCTIPESE